jgi:hypothetical protein
MPVGRTSRGRPSVPEQIGRKNGRRVGERFRRAVERARPHRAETTPRLPGLFVRPRGNGGLELGLELPGALRASTRILLEACEHDLFQSARELSSEARRGRLRCGV